MNNFSVVKSNNLIDASYRLNVQAQKLVLACLGKVDSRYDIPKEMTITAIEFGDLMGITNMHRELYLAVDALYDATITLHERDNDIELRWIQKKSKKTRGLGSVTITWSDEVLRYISSLKTRFTSYKLRHIAALQSSHSIRLYELLMKFKSTGERVIYLDDFKSALGISNRYSEFRDLNKWVIKPSIKELNKCSDLIIKYETIKKGRSVAALSFEFKQDSSQQISG